MNHKIEIELALLTQICRTLRLRRQYSFPIFSHLGKCSKIWEKLFESWAFCHPAELTPAKKSADADFVCGRTRTRTWDLVIISDAL